MAKTNENAAQFRAAAWENIARNLGLMGQSWDCRDALAQEAVDRNQERREAMPQATGIIFTDLEETAQPCGCSLQWGYTSDTANYPAKDRNVVSAWSCPLHEAAQDLLTAVKAALSRHRRMRHQIFGTDAHEDMLTAAIAKENRGAAL